MPQSSHNPAAEMQNHAEHAHTVAAASHEKVDHASAHPQSQKAPGRTRKARKQSSELNQAKLLPKPLIPGVTG